MRHSLARSGTKISREVADGLASLAALRIETRILAYVWELGRRARGRACGPAVHTLWRSLPGDVRRTLDEDAVWLARLRILDRLPAMEARAAMCGKEGLGHG